VTGAAPYANLAGLRIDFVAQTLAMFVDATLYHSSGSNTNIKVKNHSYGYNVTYITTSAEVDALVTSASAGTIHCVAAGNEREMSRRTRIPRICRTRRRAFAWRRWAAAASMPAIATSAPA